jgi:hypothetical protein
MSRVEGTGKMLLLWWGEHHLSPSITRPTSVMRGPEADYASECNALRLCKRVYCTTEYQWVQSRSVFLQSIGPENCCVDEFAIWTRERDGNLDP